MTCFSSKFIHVRKYRQSSVENLSQNVQMSQQLFETGEKKKDAR